MVICCWTLQPLLYLILMESYLERLLYPRMEAKPFAAEKSDHDLQRKKKITHFRSPDGLSSLPAASTPGRCGPFPSASSPCAPPPCSASSLRRPAAATPCRTRPLSVAIRSILTAGFNPEGRDARFGHKARYTRPRRLIPVAATTPDAPSSGTSDHGDGEVRRLDGEGHELDEAVGAEAFIGEVRLRSRRRRWMCSRWSQQCECTRQSRRFGWRRWRSLRRRTMVELEQATGEEGKGKVVFLSGFSLKSNIIIVVVSSSILPLNCSVYRQRQVFLVVHSKSHL
jgi:hypothetical protein